MIIYPKYHILRGSYAHKSSLKKDIKVKNQCSWQFINHVVLQNKYVLKESRSNNTQKLFVFNSQKLFFFTHIKFSVKLTFWWMKDFEINLSKIFDYFLLQSIKTLTVVCFYCRYVTCHIWLLGNIDSIDWNKWLSVIRYNLVTVLVTVLL